MTTWTVAGWDRSPRVGVIVPAEGSPGWIDAAFWCAVLEARGTPFRTVEPDGIGAFPASTLIVPGRTVDDRIASALDGKPGVLVAGDRSHAATRLRAVRFDHSAERLDQATTEAVVDATESALAEVATDGLIALWRWPHAKTAALVVDGDVDHPTGVDPECSRYVAPAIESATRAGYGAYGIYAAAANVDAEPGSFPPGADYYNHSYSHPYSHWNPDPWESLGHAAMRDEVLRAAAVYRSRLGVDDRAMFRLPHFQLDAWDRTADVLEALAYRADSSIGGNVSVTGGLPFHPARRAWSDRPEDAAYARTHPTLEGRRPFLQIPISTDPSDPAFLNGCCSYNTLGEGVRMRTAEPSAYARVLDEVLRRAVAREHLAHLFIDPPDAGYGRLPGDAPDYATVVEAFLRGAVARTDLAIMRTADLAEWWLARERAVGEMSWRVDDGALFVTAPHAPPGATLHLLEPDGARIFLPHEEASP